MSAGHVDYMRMMMCWWSSQPATPAVGPPYCVEAVDLYAAGVVASQGYSPGAAAADAYAPGAVAVQDGCGC